MSTREVEYQSMAIGNDNEALCDINDEAFVNALIQCLDGIPDSAVVHPITGIPNRALVNIFDDIADEDNWFAVAMANYNGHYTNISLGSCWIRTEYMLGALWIASNHPSGLPYRDHGKNWLHLLQNEVAKANGEDLLLSGEDSDEISETDRTYMNAGHVGDEAGTDNTVEQENLPDIDEYHDDEKDDNDEDAEPTSKAHSSRGKTRASGSSPSSPDTHGVVDPSRPVKATVAPRQEDIDYELPRCWYCIHYRRRWCDRCSFDGTKRCSFCPEGVDCVPEPRKEWIEGQPKPRYGQDKKKLKKSK